MSETKESVNWPLTIRAALILAGIALGFSGVFSYDRIDCQICWKDMAKHYFSIFGFVASLGFTIGWTLPDAAPNGNPGPSVKWETRRGFWEGALGVASLISVYFGLAHFFS